MKAMEIRSKTPDELTSMLTDLKKEQFNLRFQKSSGQLENTARVRVVRREIATISTVLSEKRNGVEVKTKAVAKPAAKKETPARKAPAKKAAAKKTTKSAAKKAPAKKPAAKKAAK